MRINVVNFQTKTANIAFKNKTKNDVKMKDSKKNLNLLGPIHKYVPTYSDILQKSWFSSLL